MVGRDHHVDFADSNAGAIYAYNLAAKTHISDGSKDFTNTVLAAAGNTDPQDLWSDGTTMWVLDGTNARVYAYSRSDLTHTPAGDLDLSAVADNPTGLWGSTGTLYVVDGSSLMVHQWFHGRTAPTVEYEVTFSYRHDAVETGDRDLFSDDWIIQPDGDRTDTQFEFVPQPGDSVCDDPTDGSCLIYVRVRRAGSCSISGQTSCPWSETFVLDVHPDGDADATVMPTATIAPTAQNNLIHDLVHTVTGLDPGRHEFRLRVTLASSAAN